MATDKPKGLFVMPAKYQATLFGLGAADAIADLVDLVGPCQDADTVIAECPALADIELLFSGWGAPKLDEAFLAAAPKLGVVFYGGGSIRGMVSEAMWDRGVRICSAWRINAIPVAEYTLAQIILALKLMWHYVRLLPRERSWEHSLPIPGAFGATVGIISLGEIGRGVCERLKQLDVKVIAYDPFATAADAESLGVELVSLDDIFTQADAVSLHAPNVPATKGMITGAHLASMKPYATFINTARGAIVREGEMIQALTERPDLVAVLDVTDPEPPAADSPLWEMANVVLAPHIAGSMGSECARMGWTMVAEVKRYLAGEPFEHEITRELAQTLA